MITARLYDNHIKYSNNWIEFDKKLERKTDTEISFPHVPARVQAECIHVDNFEPHPLSIPKQQPGQQIGLNNGITYNEHYIEKKKK